MPENRWVAVLKPWGLLPTLSWSNVFSWWLMFVLNAICPSIHIWISFLIIGTRFDSLKCPSQRWGEVIGPIIIWILWLLTRSNLMESEIGPPYPHASNPIWISFSDLIWAKIRFLSFECYYDSNNFFTYPANQTHESKAFCSTTITKNNCFCGKFFRFRLLEQFSV